MASSKLRTATNSSDSDCKLDMSPMIDMVFLLLIFFIVNATAIIVKTDPAINPPIASNSQPQQVKEGRIVVNVRNDGSYTAEDFDVILSNEAAIQEWVKKEKDRNEKLGIKSKLHLRGDKAAVFRHSRTAIRAASSVGVDQVVFAVFVREPK